MKRLVLLVAMVLPLLLIGIPSIVVYYFAPAVEQSSDASPVDTAPPETENQLPVKVYRTEQNRVETIPLEQYVEGVVAAEMPAEFELEALKAQALAARTYIIRRMEEGGTDVPDGAHVLDTVKHQVYLDEQQRRERWGEDFDWKNEKIRKAVRETAGLILVYDNRPIDATFFAASNGFTENADEYWSEPIPYLKSVASPWDQQSPRYEEKVSIPIAELEQKLGIQLSQQAVSNGTWYTIVERTTGNRVGKISIGGKQFHGRQFRELLGLNSTAFTLEVNGDHVIITTKGYGHGVGMSQWGANGMAQSGNNAEQIVKYYYQGVELENYTKVINS